MLDQLDGVVVALRTATQVGGMSIDMLGGVLYVENTSA
jgi:hypothetical protein